MKSGSRETTRRRSRSSLRRGLLAAVAIVGLVLGLTSLQPPDETEAAWSDSEFATNGQFVGATLNAPQIESTTCVKALRLLLTEFTVEWRLPGTVPVPDNPAKVIWTADGVPLAIQPPTPAPDATGLYSLSFDQTLLGLLGDVLFGNQVTIGLKTALGSGQWVSTSESTIDLVVPGLLGGPARCNWFTGS
ncbi:hypothetical protein [Agrococcus casei]|uniref:hypothetical protein n=1 Tax=Agrococcus casei TaxID=343512 RepID=UPI003F931618